MEFETKGARSSLVGILCFVMAMDCVVQAQEFSHVPFEAEFQKKEVTATPSNNIALCQIETPRYCICPPTGGLWGLKPGEVLAIPFQAPYNCTIDTIFFLFYRDRVAPGVALRVRILEAKGISPSTGPCRNNLPCAPTPWGYFVNPEAPLGIVPFVEEASDTTWHSCLAESTWGVFGAGYQRANAVPFAVSDQLNRFSVSDHLGEAVHLRKGQEFFIVVEIASQAPGDSSYTYFIVDLPDQDSFRGSWKFYRHPPDLPHENQCTGWWAREFTVEGVWYSYTITSDISPIIWGIESADLVFPSRSQIVSASICDLNPPHPESAGVAHARIEYRVNGGFTNTVPMSPTGNEVWTGFIPGQSLGSVVKFRVIAEDINGNSDTSGLHSFRVISLDSPNYRADTGYTCTGFNISSDGIPIDASSFFLSANGGTAGGNDGTAGPFDLGGPFLFYGDTMRYAWVGVNGAIALSKTPDDTIHLNSEGFYTDTWDIPHPAVPRNLIAPFWADWVFSDPSHSFSSGRILIGTAGDPNKFIVQWDSLGVVTENFPINDVASFRVILNRWDATIEFQYDRIGQQSQNLHNLTGMQADTSRANMLNKNGEPLETLLRDGTCSRYIPIFLTRTLLSGWNLFSLPTRSPNRSVAFVFQRAITRSFYYGRSHYIAEDSIPQHGGVWVKVPTAMHLRIPGLPIESDAIPLAERWNLVGSIGVEIPTDRAVFSGGAIQDSPFITYGAYGYGPSTVIYPCDAYWMRNSGSTGSLILSAGGGKSLKQADGFDLLNELPPGPPEDGAKIEHRTSDIPATFSLAQNYPNPFNPTTEIRFGIRDAGYVTLKVYDVLGREVATLVDGIRDAGYGQVQWDAGGLPSGVYFVRMRAGEFTQTRAAVVMK